jgi:hypothetical protein
MLLFLCFVIEVLATRSAFGVKGFGWEKVVKGELDFAECVARVVG